jgi:hypothetical protein
MLPVEAFADVVSFLGYYDLGGLKLASTLLSAVANKCADAIRLFDFSNFAFYIFDIWISIFRLEPGSWVCTLELSSEENLAEFIFEAFRNCDVGLFALMRPREHLLDATKAVASKISVVRLHATADFTENLQEFFAFIDSFRQVKV